MNEEKFCVHCMYCNEDCGDVFFCEQKKQFVNSRCTCEMFTPYPQLVML